MAISKNIETMKNEVQAHIEADAVVSGTYWENGKGCFIGCLVHSNTEISAKNVTDRFGLPEPSVRIAEHLFENLSRVDKAKGIDFFREVPDAIECDGKDLSVVHWLFLKNCLENLPTVNSEVQNVIDRVTAGLQSLIDGKKWSGAADTAETARITTASADAAASTDAYSTSAARTAAYAARTAYAATSAASRTAYAAALATVDAAAYAAYADRAATPYAVAVERQRDVFLQLLKDA